VRYVAPLKDMRFVLRSSPDWTRSQASGCEEATPETVDAILEEASKFASEVLDPLNYTGDQEGSKWHDGAVTTPKGFPDAYRKYVEGGWGSLPVSAQWGGQGLPRVVATPVEEMWCSANMSFSLCPMLTQGALHALSCAGRDAAEDVPAEDGERRVDRHDEPHRAAGRLGPRARSHARRAAGRPLPVSGQKIFITYGEHDLAENIVHLVLARTPTAPEGVKGISLFVVPKFLVNADGSLGKRNTATCASIEHKLGIHASPTAVLVFDKARRLPRRRGEPRPRVHVHHDERRALRVGLEGVAIAERAFQRALAYAKERVQGATSSQAARRCRSSATRRAPDADADEVADRGDARARVRHRGALDAAHLHPGQGRAQRNQAFVDLIIPVVKGWCTETASRSRRSACRSTAAWDSSRRPAPRSTIATRGSRRSTKARPASRRTTSSGARSRARRRHDPRADRRAAPVRR
jgi:alkylation response protein AidB-like acyl-CoA dehydrogenase